MFLNLEDFEYVEEGYGEWEIIESGDWVSSGKWEYFESIVYNKESGKFYKYCLSRSGSYYSDYYYKHIEDDGGVYLNEVIPYEEAIVVKKWKEV